MKIQEPKTESQIKLEKWKESPKKSQWKHLSPKEQIDLEDKNSKIENLFAKGKRVIVISQKAKSYLSIIIENKIDTELEIGESFIVEECIDLSNDKGFYLKILGIKLKEDRMGFERLFPSSYFAPESSARNVLQGLGYKFGKDNKIIVCQKSQ